MGGKPQLKAGTSNDSAVKLWTTNMSARCRSASDHFSTKNLIPEESNNVIFSYGGKKSNYDL